MRTSSARAATSVPPAVLGQPHHRAELQRDGDQPLLRAVVQITFQPPAGRVAGADQASRGGPQLPGLLLWTSTRAV